MKETFNILNRFTDKVQVTVEIEFDGNILPSVKLGLAVKAAIAKGADLYGANLYGADLLAYGNMSQIKTLQLEEWQIGYTKDTMQIGCQRHEIEKWRKWNTEAGRKWISMMDSGALEWADKWLDLVLSIIDKSPANE